MDQSFAHHLTLFANGIADVRRRLTTENGREVSIPVRSGHVGDVLASLSVQGPVTLVRPPTFTRQGVEDQFADDPPGDADDVFVRLAETLRGAHVEIVPVQGEPCDGRLMGLDQQPKTTKESRVRVRYWLILTADGTVRRFAQPEIRSYRFTEPRVQAALDKSLRRSLAKLPGATALLCHAVETGVRIVRKVGSVRREKVHIGIDSGSMVRRSRCRRRLEYRLANAKDQPFDVLLDVPAGHFQGDPAVSATLDGDGLPDVRPVPGGHRCRFTLAASATATLECMGVWQESQRERMTLQELRQDRWPGDGPESDALRSAAAEQDEAKKSLERLKGDLMTAKDEQDRVKELLAASPGHADWLADLERTETEIRTLTRESVPAARTAVTDAGQRLEEALAEIAWEWSRDDAK